MSMRYPSITRLLLLAASSGLIALVWGGVLPWIANRPLVAKRLAFLEQRGIDPSAMFYTELEVMDPILDRIENRADQRSQSNTGELLAVHLVTTDAVSDKSSFPPGELGEMVRLGEQLVNNTNTHPLTKRFVGNSLSCTSCHLDAGRHPRAASFIGVAAAYPAFSPREAKVITLEDRILNCFIRSQNGTRPPNGSKASVAIATYITWLSTGTPIKMNDARPLGPNYLKPLAPPDQSASVVRGKALYVERCAICHGDAGEGSEEGPPVWGEDSFNDGAGLSKVPKMASWLKVAMPLDDADLSDQEAFDIAAYVNAQKRPSFSGE